MVPLPPWLLEQFVQYLGWCPAMSVPHQLPLKGTDYSLELMMFIFVTGPSRSLAFAQIPGIERLEITIL